MDESSVFNSLFYILVKGSPTKDFVVPIGIQNGDPLSPFLFLLVVEGFVEMFKTATSVGEFDGFRIGQMYNLRCLNLRMIPCF